VLAREQIKIDSIEPAEGREGTIVTIRGSGFGSHVRNNCAVVGGMAACARAEPDSTPTELKVRIGPVAEETGGEVLVWPGIGAELHTEDIHMGATRLEFSEAAIFRNGAPVASAGVAFKLTEVSPNTYKGKLEPSAASQVRLGGHEKDAVMRVHFPEELRLSQQSSVDICLVLKEPTLAIDITATISGHDNDEDALRAIAKGISTNAELVGEQVHADVARNADDGGLELYVTKPHLLDGMLVVHFNPA
jgi:hypothetical protein